MKYMQFALIASAVALVAQDLTPRELFFAAPVIKAKAAAAVPRPAGEKQSASASARTKAQPPVSVPQVIPAAYVSEQPPLGLRYSLLLSRNNESYREVDSGIPFRSGDRLKITVEANDQAYLYVIARGSSGLWKILFPISEVANGDNLIQPFRRYEVPNGGRFYFDEQAGEEKLFVLLSRKPEANFEDLIYSVNAPAARQAAAAPMKSLQVSASIRPIDDALVGKVRNELVARDLVFEKVDEMKSAAASKQPETAVYVVNRHAGPNGKVIVDLKLEHK